MKRLLALAAPAATFALLVAPLASSGAAAAEPAPPVAGAGAFPWPIREFCGRVQAYVTGSTPRVTNTVHDGVESFKRTPPQVQPLTTQQYDWPDDRGPPRSAAMISCKLVTADRVKATHGAQAARAEGSCEQVNRYVYDTVLRSLAPAERERALFGKGSKVRFERDRLLGTPQDWYPPYEMVSVDGSGRLRIRANALRVDWTDAKQAQRPEQDRGVHFCHFVAPEYLRRLLLDPSIVLPGPPVRR